MCLFENKCCCLKKGTREGTITWKLILLEDKFIILSACSVCGTQKHLGLLRLKCFPNDACSVSVVYKAKKNNFF